MSIATAVAAILEPLAVLITKWIEEGVDNEEIHKRLGNPAHVGDDLLDGVRERLAIGRRLLNRDPE
jgi:hypothetical protein